MAGPRIVVSGLIAQYPLGGVAWDYVQYIAGLVALGYDAYYIEDTGIWPYNPEEGGVSKTCDYNVRYLNTVMERFGLADRWAYCFAHDSQWFGLSDAKRNEVLKSADLLLNISGTLAAPAKYRSIETLAYIDSDPVFTQVKLARGETSLVTLMGQHDVHFSFGEALPGNTPATDYKWIPTRQPILLDEWKPVDERREMFTTVMNWTTARPIEHAGVSYGQKDVEFQRFIDLPQRVKPTEIELAVNLGKTKRTPHDLLRHKGWRLADPDVVCPDLEILQALHLDLESGMERRQERLRHRQIGLVLLPIGLLPRRRAAGGGGGHRVRRRDPDRARRAALPRPGGGRGGDPRRRGGLRSPRPGRARHRRRVFRCA